MERTFRLKKGEIVFGADKLIITDKALMKWRILLFFSASALILGLTSLIAWFTPGDQYQSWLGFFLGISFIMALVAAPFRSFQNEIDLKEVKSMKLTRGFFGEYLEIKLGNKKIRRVYDLVEKEELREFIDTDSISKPLFESNAFEIKKGKIVFEADKIVITDHVRSQKFSILLLLASSIFLGTAYFSGYLKKGDRIGLWLGVFLLLINIPAFFLMLLRSTQNEISLKEVKSMKIKHRFGNVFLDIKLKNYRTRRVTEIFNPERLKAYIHILKLS